MNNLNANNIQFTIRQSIAFAKNWAPTAVVWGATGTMALLYTVQPRVIFKHLPIVGDNYLTAKDLQAKPTEE
ncbi:hypothetical protein PPL_07982 [Heterostelium album PN500]|uniref:Uncharacterized protein n=1 Tax=Heterostelium pallidum (strain ATCC 26659 / Pp 5 / PN500) TaxID=670386 RepID=D3BHI0_HETP5|nr:hypothetical protein PPL_07982 [Heterostelium album PN500]EFA79157.1 hypothetical protein PPL_07982 [Heterostelium album PN500]|eukprot:XP_020431279.1 hypothetical protein PPL_07982 [Heterostelium album PN500]